MTVKAITNFRWPIDGKVQDIIKGETHSLDDKTEKLWIAQNRAVDAKPAKQEDADAQLLLALKRLETSNEEHWNKDGTPKVAAVETFLGRDTNAKEIKRVAPDLKRPE